MLGLERTDASGFANAYDGGGASLRVTRVDRLAPAAHTVLGWRVADVRASLGALAARGIAARRFTGLEQDADAVWTSPSGAHVAWFEDPDGNVLSLTEMPTDETAHDARPAPAHRVTTTRPKRPTSAHRAGRSADRDNTAVRGDPTTTGRPEGRPVS